MPGCNAHRLGEGTGRSLLTTCFGSGANRDAAASRIDLSTRLSERERICIERAARQVGRFVRFEIDIADWIETARPPRPLPVLSDSQRATPATGTRNGLRAIGALDKR